MTALQLRHQRQRQQAILRRQRAERRGSTLLIVLVLMAMLASLGVIFYVFAAQERASANYYSDAAKVKQFDISADTLFDFGIRQVIEGPDVGKFRNSALSGRRHALLPNMLGLNTDGKKLDFSPYNGTALTSADSRYLAINDSGSANNGNPVQSNRLANLDPDYTYPDNTNVFLSYMGYDPVQGRKIIIPSFHRPQAGSVRSLADWYENSATANQVLRPHPNHIWMPTAGQRPPNPAVPRFLKTSDLAALGGNWSTWGAFPFAPYNGDGGAIGEQGVWSLTSPPTAGAALPATADAYEYDVDNDGDGVREGVWLDVDFPLLEDASGMQYVPLFSYTIVDADALLNLNVHGNMARVWSGDVRLDAMPFRGSSTTDAFISKSNQGLIASEVNPLWALNRRPPVTGGSFLADRYDSAYAADPFFGGTVGGPVPENWKEAANRDWLYLLMGRYSTTPSDLVPGRWGEEHLLYRAITNTPVFNALGFSLDNTLSNILPNPWPGPGQTQTDDNGDLPKVTGDWFGSTNQQAFGMPLDYTGLGSYWQLSGAPGYQKLGNYGFTAGLPARWPMFNRYSSSSSRPVQWPNTGLSGTLAYGLFNDAGEMVIDSDAKRDEDGVFGVEEMQALHLVNTDFAVTTGGQSRLTQLAPYNFDATSAAIGSGSNARSTQEFRSKFTTRSWDRKQFSLTWNDARSWEFSADADNDLDENKPSLDNRPSVNQALPWAGLEFPPQYGTYPAYPNSPNGSRRSTGSVPAYKTDYTTGADPFRPVLRRLLETELGNFDQPRYQMRLNLNQLLVGPNGHPSPSLGSKLPPNIQLHYRPLTPHPDQAALTAAPIGMQADYPANGNFTSAAHQEFWARKDRQLMARDLYVLLYTLCWPDGINPTGNGKPNPTGAPTATALDTSSNLVRQTARQFAQYAANVVDSLDRDKISTRFEFDINLSNGWNRDDDPYSTTDNTDRYEVYGVERLELTLSEAAAVRAEEVSSGNVTFTQWDDSTMDGTHFAYVELRNPGPNSVSFTNRAWRVEVGPDAASVAAVPAGDLPTVRRLDLRAGPSVAAGDIYTIGSVDHTAGGTNPSIMKVGISGSAPGDWDADTTSWIMPAQRPLDLDLKNASQATNFDLKDAQGNAVPTGALYDNVSYQKVRTTPLYFRLYRRVSPDRPFPNSATEDNDNPFVLVDEIAINDATILAPAASTPSGPAGQVTFASSDTTTDITGKLSNLRSRQKSEPFTTVNSNGYAFQTPSGPYANTLGAANGNSPTTFNNWQKVFDRDFASPGELLQVTLGGFSDTDELYNNSAIVLGRAPLPGIVTELTVNDPYLTVTSDTTSNSTPPGKPTISSDAEMLFRPASTPTGGSGGTTAASRWYRLLEFVEVASRMQASVPGFPDPLDYPRVTGKLNLNMFRHPDTLAAVIDDPSVMSFQVDEDENVNGSFDPGEDTNGNNALDVLTVPRLRRTDNGIATENWWQALIESRDGRRVAGVVDPDPTAGLYLPGTTSSVPFRSFSQPLGAYESVERTLLRSWHLDPLPTTDTSASSRQLFELGTLPEHQGTATALDPYVRSRILNKIMNNVTTRSNVFVIFASIKYFRAHRHASGAVQIGGPLKDPSILEPERSKPELRRFYVVDRSQIEKAYDPQSGTFNFRALIEFEQNLPLQ